MMFNIPAWKETEFNKKINSLKRKGLKFDCIKVDEGFVTGSDDQMYFCNQYEVTADMLYAENGWSFIGVIQHTENGNIISKAAEVVVPNEYYSVPCKCDHCNTIRNRKDTYLVRNSEGEFKQVGKSCLKDYTGLNPASCVAAMDLEEEISKMDIDRLPADEFISRNASSFKGYIANEVKAIAIEIVKKNGYISNSDASFSNVPSTRDLIMKAYGTNYADRASMDEVNAINEWADEAEVRNDYVRNAKTAFKMDYLEYRNIALVASFINSYYKDMAYKAKMAAIEAANKAKAESSSKAGYLGNEKEKVQFKVSSARVLYTCGSFSYYGPETVAWEIVDTEGHIIIWKTTQAVQPGEVYKATIKNLQEYKGIPQTVITRGTLIQGA